MTSIIDLKALAAWMDEQAIESGPLGNVRDLAGGTQNILIRFTRGHRTMVLRRPPLHMRSNSNQTMVREAVVLKALAQTNIPHARLIAACSDESVMGCAFYLMEEINGFNATTGLPEFHASSEAVRHRMGLALVEAAASLGELDYLALGLESFGKPDNYLERQVSRWSSQLDGYSRYPAWRGLQDLPDVKKVATWLENNRPSDFRAGIIHGDYHLANVMYQNDSPELAAIVDWELATIGDPLLDLAWVLATWPDADDPYAWPAAVEPWSGFASGAELIAHYQKHSTRDMSHFDWYRVLAYFKLGILLEGSYARASNAEASQEIGNDLHNKAVRLFERAVHSIC